MGLSMPAIGRKKRRKTVCIVGLGGLGSSTSSIMASGDSADIVLIDDDMVELTNLQRQVLYAEEDVGKSKAAVAKERLLDINPGISIRSNAVRLVKENIDLLRSDLILDCTDNLETRHLINRYAAERGIPWVYCSVAGSYGFAKAITADTACIECILKGKDQPESLGTSGVLSTAVLLAASVQCRLAYDLLLGKKPADELIHFDSWSQEMTKVQTRKDPGCGVCGR